MKLFKVIVPAILLLQVFAACHEKVVNPNQNITLQNFEQMDTSAFRLNSHRIAEYINVMMRNDGDSMIADFRTRSFYIRNGGFLWISRCGIDSNANTLLSYISKVEELGFSLEKFRVHDIEEDIRRFRNLDFDTTANSINKVMARLEYNLTKAYLRYTTGMRFGFVNPDYVFNRIDVHDSNSVRVTYRGLFDIPIDKAGNKFFEKAFHEIETDSVAEFLKAVQPLNTEYYQLKKMLSNTIDKATRARIICNMERFRWRQHDNPSKYKKYVMVNIPSFHLLAVDGDEEQIMRIGCGTYETKTPLLVSRIKRMDVNPQWIIPRSIVKKSILHHIGNSHYWESNRYFVRERKTGKIVPFNHVTWAMLNDADNYIVAQQGGEGNSLGRIIFRFDNSFSVFLHDTSSKGIFSREDRGVSHGCVRVERPFDLAVFMLEDKDKNLIDKIHYSMTAAIGCKSTVTPEENENEIKEEQKDTLRHNLIINSIPVKPHIPLFITYFTMYPDKNGHWQTYNDVYGYDRVIYTNLKNFGCK